MKKTFTLVIFFVYMLATAQNTYSQFNFNFSQSTTTYSAISGGTNAFNYLWDDEVEYVPIGFTFNYLGKNYTEILIISNGALAFDTDNTGMPLSSEIPVIFAFGDYSLGGIGADLIDRGDSIGIPQSPIVYMTSGVAPNRIFTVEWKNAGFYNEGPPYASFVNVMARLYEGSNNIEIIMGPHSVDPGLYDAATGPVIGLSLWDSFNFNFISGLLLNGAPGSATTTSSYTTLDSTPATGTVYTFTPGSVNVTEIKMSNLLLYPNPVVNKLIITIPTGISYSTYSISDVTGKVILKDNIAPGLNNFMLDVESFPHGMYLLNLTGGDATATTRFVK